MDKINILQLGGTPVSECFELPKEAALTYIERAALWPKKEDMSPDVVFLFRAPGPNELRDLQVITKAYTLFYDEKINVNDDLADFFSTKLAKAMSEDEFAAFINDRLKYYFHTSYGEKLGINLFGVAEGFKGKVSWIGNYRLVLDSDFGEEFKQVAYWRRNIPISSGQTLDVVLEYDHTPGVEIRFKAVQFQSGSICNIVNEWLFSEEQLKDIVHISNEGMNGTIFYSIQAKGKGTLKLGGIHERYSRIDEGIFIPGGERYVAESGEELFCYFDPGDYKPPFSVFFSGYKTKQGFEGLNLMRKKGKPFLLISEAQLEGGAFYMGSTKYEKMIVDVIRSYIRKLNFKSKDVIMAGISMGTFGATYYGCDILPGAIILGKPLFSIGNVAANERINRPGGFPTSVDLLLYLYGSTGEEAREKLNARFWDKFDKTDWHNTKFVVSYMYEDDYDSGAYSKFLSHISTSGVSVSGKGIHGRHNDDTNGIVEWFNRQYDKLIEDFERTERFS